jgi:adenylate cyclase
MGPPTAPNYSAIGDCVNAAARLQTKTRELECILVVTDEVVQNAGADFSQFPSQQISLDGKQQSVLAYLIKNPLDVPLVFNDGSISAPTDVCEKTY